MPNYLITNATLIDGTGQRRASLRTDGNHIAEIIPPNATTDHDCQLDSQLVDSSDLAGDVSDYFV